LIFEQTKIPIKISDSKDGFSAALFRVEFPERRSAVLADRNPEEVQEVQEQETSGTSGKTV
jgi:hypothetical protein